eukprot:3769891-Rhodomonas_salina.5
MPKRAEGEGEREREREGEGRHFLLALSLRSRSLARSLRSLLLAFLPLFAPNSVFCSLTWTMEQVPEHTAPQYLQTSPLRPEAGIGGEFAYSMPDSMPYSALERTRGNHICILQEELTQAEKVD